jgi:hypothetical protein
MEFVKEIITDISLTIGGDLSLILSQNIVKVKIQNPVISKKIWIK